MSSHKLSVVFFVAATLIACRQEPTAGGNTTEKVMSDSASSEVRSMVFRPDLPFEDIKKKLQGSDKNQMANDVIQLGIMSERPEVVHLLEALWANSVNEYPDLKWDVVQTPHVRVVLAGVLGRWNPGDLKYRSYILTEVNRTEGADKMHALVSFGSVATDEDIGYLNNIAMQPDELGAVGALSALQTYASDAAIKTLEKIKDDPKVSEQVRRVAAQMLGLPRSTR